METLLGDRNQQPASRRLPFVRVRTKHNTVGVHRKALPLLKKGVDVLLHTNPFVFWKTFLCQHDLSISGSKNNTFRKTLDGCSACFFKANTVRKSDRSKKTLSPFRPNNKNNKNQITVTSGLFLLALLGFSSQKGLDGHGHGRRFRCGSDNIQIKPCIGNRFTRGTTKSTDNNVFLFEFWEIGDE